MCCLIQVRASGHRSFWNFWLLKKYVAILFEIPHLLKHNCIAKHKVQRIWKDIVIFHHISILISVLWCRVDGMSLLYFEKRCDTIKLFIFEWCDVASSMSMKSLICKSECILWIIRIMKIGLQNIMKTLPHYINKSILIVSSSSRHHYEVLITTHT